MRQDYNPGQNSFGHLRTNDGNRINSQHCHRKTSSPSPSGPMMVWKVKWKLGSVQMIINIDFGEREGVIFQFTEGNWMFRLTVRQLSQWFWPGLEEGGVNLSILWTMCPTNMMSREEIRVTASFCCTCDLCNRYLFICPFIFMLELILPKLWLKELGKAEGKPWFAFVPLKLL